ncbi:glycosyltransferase family 32 protein [Acetobacter estunensis]|uniref:glycosyltransferase family 32 protein n=1 Tax=Acetobacter estunensis TaxID=104097 RepID=UPI001C2D0EEC|nr:glycosyltransferase [Acetobacter estunensis]MBV1837569.1 hypothetical protein [Acetobacter estunensis]
MNKPRSLMDYDLLVPFVEEGETIPKIVHHIYFCGTIPEVYRRYINQMKANNPDYEFRQYDEASARAFILKYYSPEVLAYYERINPEYAAARSDFLRYLLIYAVGGLYFDVKSGIEGKIDASISGDEGFILTQWQNQPGQPDEGVGLRKAVPIPGGEYQQWHVIGCKGHPFLRAVIPAMLKAVDDYRPWTHLTGRIGVLNVTGPIMYSNTIYPLVSRYRHKLYRYDRDIHLIYAITGRDNHVDGRHYSVNRNSVVVLPLHLKVAFFLYRVWLNLKWRLNGKKAFVHPDY